MNDVQQKQIMEEVSDTMKKIRQMKCFIVGKELHMKLSDNGHWEVVRREEGEENG